MQQGSYVLCIDDSNWDLMAHFRMTSLPKKNEIYIVRRIIPRINKNCEEDGIALEGIYGDWDFWISFKNERIFEECHFRKSRFIEIIPPELFTETISENLEPKCEEIT
jgi:hypothetical protein